MPDEKVTLAEFATRLGCSTEPSVELAEARDAHSLGRWLIHRDVMLW